MVAPLQIAWGTVLADIAHLLGEDTPTGREPAGSRTLAAYLQVNRSTLLRWQDGSEPRHSDGEVILLAWCRLTGKSAAFVPRERTVLSAAKMR